MNRTRQLILGAVLIAFGLIVPSIFHYFSLGGRVFLPMHIPVLLAGMLLSPSIAVIVGILTPVMSTLLTGMPPVFPTMTVMMFELGSYALITALMRRQFKLGIYPSLIIGILSGRAVGALVTWFISFFVADMNIHPLLYIANNFMTGLPGIILQLVLIPVMTYMIESTNLYKENHI